MVRTANHITRRAQLFLVKPKLSELSLVADARLPGWFRVSHISKSRCGAPNVSQVRKVGWVQLCAEHARPG